MSNQENKCPNCSADIKSSLMSSNKLLNPNQVALINLFEKNESSGYCEKCGKSKFNQYKGKLNEQKTTIEKQIVKGLKSIPIVTSHSPLNWEYEVLGLVTGQSTTGTGFLSEFTSSWTDDLGIQSTRHNKKLKQGEELCSVQIRMQTVQKGGNAIIATDIDYSELGGGKGMIMVCMSGTAIRLKNLDILPSERGEKLETLEKTMKNLKKINELV